MSKKKIKTIPKEEIIKIVKDAYIVTYVSIIDRISGQNNLEDLNINLVDPKHSKRFDKFLEIISDNIYVFWDDLQFAMDAYNGKKITPNDIIENIYEHVQKNGVYTYDEWIKLTGLDQM